MLYFYLFKDFRCSVRQSLLSSLLIYALALAFAGTNVPLSSERTWTLFHHPLKEGVNVLNFVRELKSVSYQNGALIFEILSMLIEYRIL